MELHYTLDEKDYRRLVEAVARTKGSASHKVARTFCIFMVIVAGLPYGCVLWRAVVANGAAPLALAVDAVFLAVPLAVLIGLGYFLGVKLAYLGVLATLGRGGVQQLVGKPCTLRLQDGILYDEGPAVGPLAAKVTRPAAALRTVRTDSFGLVLVFRDGTGLGVPLSAFNRAWPPRPPPAGPLPLRPKRMPRSVFPARKAATRYWYRRATRPGPMRSAARACAQSGVWGRIGGGTG